MASDDDLVTFGQMESQAQAFKDLLNTKGFSYVDNITRYGYIYQNVKPDFEISDVQPSGIASISDEEVVVNSFNGQSTHVTISGGDKQYTFPNGMEGHYIYATSPSTTIKASWPKIARADEPIVVVSSGTSYAYDWHDGKQIAVSGNFKFNSTNYTEIEYWTYGGEGLKAQNLPIPTVVNTGDFATISSYDVIENYGRGSIIEGGQDFWELDFENGEVINGERIINSYADKCTINGGVKALLINLGNSNNCYVENIMVGYFAGAWGYKYLWQEYAEEHDIDRFAYGLDYKRERAFALNKVDTIVVSGSGNIIGYRTKTTAVQSITHSKMSIDGANGNDNIYRCLGVGISSVVAGKRDTVAAGRISNVDITLEGGGGSCVSLEAYDLSYVPDMGRDTIHNFNQENDILSFPSGEIQHTVDDENNSTILKCISSRGVVQREVVLCDITSGTIKLSVNPEDLYTIS